MFNHITKTLCVPLLASLMVTGVPSQALKPLGLETATLTAFAQTKEEQTRIQVYEKASPAVVTIMVEGGHGSGFLVTPDGLVLTNAHVLKHASQTVPVILADGRKVTADVVGFESEGLDVAALKIRNQTNLPTLPLASPNSVKVGQSVYAIGTPFDFRFQNTFTSGIVSRVDTRRGIIQHDAPINGGNSGGPLLNSDGEVIGINTWLYNPSRGRRNWVGISLAIAIEEAQPFLVALQQGDDSRIATQPRNNNNTIPTQPLPVNGQTIAAALKPGDPTLPNNTYIHVYAFQGRAGQKVSIEMNSEQLDPGLLLYFPGEETLTLVEQNDDRGINDFNARLVTTLPKTGTYFVLANAFEKGEVGAYEIRASFL